MKYKSYYYEENGEILIIPCKEIKPSYDEAKKEINYILINLNTKNVEKIYDFFKCAIVEEILNDYQTIDIDFSEIEDEEFYTDSAFEELVKLINNLKDKCNKCISDLKNIIETRGELKS